ncbi:SH3 domain-containing protein [Tieghemostelium lacteum]|uniref:SH3 domain-containing protein n=1 Tax=Tieghemostelium lacteum TaxID=361077 RepID=A0A151ZS46_TIELA|nr:SH3 domain-containing protein [Tieghemostelium lacteum]|eukprot:KYQ96758.1 SH3 domain-containing protein [Tieghemostelium lacteum]
MSIKAASTTSTGGSTSSSGSSTPRKADEWTSISKTGIVLFPFNATHKFQLPLSVGDFVQIHAQTSNEQTGWYSGVSVTTQESGIFPQSYVVLLPDQQQNSLSPTSTTTETDNLHIGHVPICSKLNLTNENMSNSTLVNEITTTVVEWATLLKILSQNKQYNDFKVLSQKITQLVQFRNQLLQFQSPKEISLELRDKVLGVIDEGRRETGMTIVIRKEINPLTLSSTTSTLSNSNSPSNSRISSRNYLSGSTGLTNSQNNNGGIVSDLILADAENSGVFALCTMYQEKKHQTNMENRMLESAKKDMDSLLKDQSSLQNNSSSSNLNNVLLSSTQSPNNLLSQSTSSSSPLNISSGGQLLQQQQQQPQQQQTSNSNSNSNISSKEALPKDSPISGSSGGGSGLIYPSSPGTPLSSSPAQNSPGKLSKLPSSINFLSSVRLKNKTSSSGSGLNLSGSGSSIGAGSGQSNQGGINGGSGQSPSSASPSSAVSQSFISVTSSPSSLSTSNGSNSGSSGSGPLSSLNLNSPILSNNSSMIKKKSGTTSGKSSKSFLLNSNNSGSYAEQTPVKQLSQMLVSLNNFLYSSGEYLDIVLNIYNKTDSRMITESYCGVVPPSGIFVEPENPSEKIRTIFRDFEPKDFNSELYLIAKLYRKTNSVASKDPNSSPTLTRSNPSTSSGSGSNLAQTSKLFRKYIGCGIKKLDLSSEGTSEILLTLHTSSQENLLYNLHENIINEVSGTFEPISRAKGVVLTLQLFHGDYQQFVGENPDYRSVTTSLKTQLPEVVLPGSDRNDMYINIEEGDFSEKNVEVTMQIRTESGQILHDAIKFANGQPESSEFRTPLNANSICKWNEMVKVWVSAKHFDKCHLFFLARTCSEKKDKERSTFAFGYLKFQSDEGAIIKDGLHSLNFYKTSTDDVPISTYINGVTLDGKIKKLDTLKIKTTFISNCLTQNPTVVNLSKWQTFQGDLNILIKDTTFLTQQDIMKNLQEIFYNFLSILDQQLNDSPLSMEIFKALVFIIGQLVDSRTINYRPALDLYVSKYFGLPLAITSMNHTAVGIAAHSHLLRSVVKNLDNFQDPSNASKISSSLKALEYIFKMVVASKTKFASREMDGENTSYQANLKSVVDILCEIMISNSPSLIGAQTIALKNFESMFSDLKKFFTIEEMAIIALKFMKSIQSLEKNKTFNLLKLKLLSSYIHGPLMLHKETRKQLHSVVFQLLQFHFGKSVEETDMSLTILGLIVDIMITKPEFSRGKDKDSWLIEMMNFFVPVLEVLQLMNISSNTSIESLKRRSSSSVSLNGASNSVSLSTMVTSMTEENQNDLRIKIYAFLLGTARLAGVQHWEMVSKNLLQLNKSFFLDLFESLQLLYESPKFPSDFWTFTVFQLKTILRMTRILEDVIFFIPSNNSSAQSSASSESNGAGAVSSKGQFEFPLWRSFFLMTSSYLNCKDLQFESVNPAKAVFLKSRCGDVRIEMARVLERVWSTVPVKDRASFIPILINPIIKLSINDTLDAKRVATKIFYDMLESEIIQTNSYSELFDRTVDSLVEIGTSISDGVNWPNVCRGLDQKLPFNQRSFSTFFNAQCMSLVLNKSSEQTKKKSESFIQDINQFLQLITTFMNDIKSQDEEEIFSSVTKMLQYFSERKRQQHFIRFVHLTAKRHLALGNYIESAVTLLLHASLYQWDHNRVVNAIQFDYVSFPEQKESERKELLYKDILNCYSQGKAWDRAIPLIKELIHHFTMNICDMNAAATYLRQQGVFYQKINDLSDPVFEEYFRVGYYGKRFPQNLQNREFIYKGNEFERLSDFISKTQDKWPKAELLKATDIPPQSIQDSDQQYLLITSVQVSNISETQKRQSVSASSGSKKRLPHRQQQFNARNKVNVFLYSKPIKKTQNGTKSQNEFEDLWIQNLYLICESSFPTTERRSLIVERKLVELSPIENALNTMTLKNEELLARIDKHQANPQENLNPLSMCLNGIIDACVNGGISRYETFLSEDYLKQNQEYKPIAELLKSSMDQQFVILEQGLKLHSTLRPPELAGMHEKLESIFNQMKTERQQKHNNIL